MVVVIFNLLLNFFFKSNITLLILLPSLFILTKVNSLDKTYIYILLFFVNNFLLNCSNLLNIFLYIEVISYSVVFLMLVNLINTTQRVSTVIYYVIYNFFSSFFFIISLSIICYKYGNIFFMHNDSYYCKVFSLFFLIKISSGSTLLLNIEVYKGLYLVDILLYTGTFYLVFLYKFVFIYINYGLIIDPFVVIIFGIIYLNYITTLINSISSIKVFLQISSGFLLFFILILMSLYN